MGDLPTRLLAGRWKPLWILLGFCILVYLFLFSPYVLPVASHSRASVTVAGGRASSLGHKQPTPDILRSLRLTDQQCVAAFPGLTKDIDDMVALGPFTLTSSGDLGPLLARIKDNQVCHAQ
jgi:hypothetical protein